MVPRFPKRVTTTNLPSTNTNPTTVKHEPNTTTTNMASLPPNGLHIDRTLASDPRTPTERLTAFVRHRDRDVRARTAANPNTPTQTLDTLARHFPHQVAKNPILDWLLLENANWLEELSEVSRARLLAAPNVPVGLLWWATRNGTRTDQLAVAQNPSSPIDLLEALVNSEVEESVKIATRLHVTMRAYEEAMNRADRAVKDHQATGSIGETFSVDLESHEKPTEQPIEQMSLAEVLTGALKALPGSAVSAEAMITISLTHRLPPWLLPVIRAGDVDGRRLLARHHLAPPEQLAALAFDDDSETRRFARSHPAIGTDIANVSALLELAEVELSDRDLAITMTYGSSGFARQRLAALANIDSAFGTPLVNDEDWRVREAAAKNPTLPDFDQRHLAVDSDKDVRIALATNPNVDIEILDVLATDRHEGVVAAVRSHPRYRGARAEHALRHEPPVWLIDAAANGAPTASVLLAGHPLAGRERLVAFVTHDWRVRQAVAWNTNVDVDLLESLALDSDGDVREAVARNTRTPEQLTLSMCTDQHSNVRVGLASGRYPSVLRVLANDPSVSIREVVAKNPNTPTDVIVALAAEEDRSIHAALAARPELPEEALLRVCTSDDNEVRRTLLQRSDLSDHALATLFRAQPNVISPHPRMDRLWLRIQSGDETVSRREAALFLAATEWAGISIVVPRIPPNALLEFARSADWRVRQVTAQHPRTPKGVLRILADDSDYDVRAAAVANESLPRGSLAKHASDNHQLVRLAIAKRTDTPARLLEELIIDENEDVVQAALHHPNVPMRAKHTYEQIMQQAEIDETTAIRLLGGSVSARKRVAATTGMSAATLDRLANDEDWRVREVVGQNMQAPVTALKRLGRDHDRDVRRGVAGNRSTPRATLAILIRDTDDGVRFAALGNPRLPTKVKHVVLREQVRRAIRSTNRGDRIIAIACAAPMGFELSRRSLWQSPEWVERYVLAQHPDTPSEILGHLADDANKLIRACAMEKLSERSGVGASSSHPSKERAAATKRAGTQ